MSKNLFKTYEVNGRTYTDNLGENAIVGIPKKQWIEYEQQEEEIERLHSIIKEAREFIENENIDVCSIRHNDILDLKQEFLEILDKVEENSK